MHLRIMFTHEDEVLYSMICPFHRSLYRKRISVFKLFYKHNTLVKESYMGFRACELNRSENQFSPLTSLRFLNHRRWPVPSFSGTYFVCICEHIFLTRYNELFLGKGTKIAKIFLHKNNIKKSSGDWLLHLSGCKSC